MSKKQFLAIGVLLLVPILTAGCGVSQEELDSVLVERDAAQGQVVSLQSDLSTAQSQFQALKGECDNKEAKIAKAAAYTRAWHILLYKARKQAGIAQQLSYASDAEWIAALMKSVEATGDNELHDIVKVMEKGGA